MGNTELSLTVEAERTISRMRERVKQIADAYGEESKEHVAVLKSMLEALMGVMRLGGRVWPEDQLSLCAESWITYGVIWHSKYLEGQLRDPLLGEWTIHS